MENEIKKLRKQVIATQTICILMLVVLLGMMVGILQIVRVFGEYKDDLDRAATLVRELKKADIPQLAEDIHNIGIWRGLDRKVLAESGIPCKSLFYSLRIVPDSFFIV